MIEQSLGHCPQQFNVAAHQLIVDAIADAAGCN
jgi:hypothetical protein